MPTISTKTEEPIGDTGFDFEKYADTPLEQIPDDQLILLFLDTPINEIPEQVRARVTNSLVAEEAERRGPEEAGFSGLTSEQAAEMAPFAPAGMGIQRINAASLEGFKDGLLDSLRGLGLAPKKTFEEEFETRVELARAPEDYFSGMLTGAVVDPVGIAAGGVGGKLAVAGATKALPNAPRVATALGITAGGGAEGAAQGALIPVYEEFGDSRLMNTLYGAGIGTVLGGAVGTAGAIVTPPLRAPEVKPELAPQPVSLQPKALSGQDYKPRMNRPVETPVTTAAVELTPQVTRSTPATLKVQNIDQQIADLEQKAQQVGRKKRKPIEKQIEKLRVARQNELNQANKQAAVIKEKVVSLENQLDRLSRRKEELQPGEAGAKARQARAERRAEELQEEIDTLTGLDYSPNGGYVVTISGVGYDNPLQIANKKNRLELNNPTGAEISVKLEPPKPTGDPVTDAANKLNYILNSDDAAPRLGLDAPPSASSAGVRPAVQYAQEVSEGIDSAIAQQAGEIAPSTARGRAEMPVGRDIGRQEEMTKEEVGRRATLLAASTEQKQRQQAKQMGFKDEDVDWAIQNLPTISERKFTYENVEQAAARLKAGPIGRDYDTLVDFVMDQNRMFTAEEMEALRPLFIEANNRVDQTLKQMRKLKKDGQADSAEMVKLVEDLYFNNYMAEMQRTNGRAASHVLSQAKKTKRFVAENTRRVNQNQLITNLFGVKCG